MSKFTTEELKDIACALNPYYIGLFAKAERATHNPRMKAAYFDRAKDMQKLERKVMSLLAQSVTD